MRLNRIRQWMALAFAAGLLAGNNGTAFSKEPASTALELARQLNQAFIEVADQVSPSVVVIRVAHKQSFSDPNMDEDNPFWDLIPRQFRKQLEEQQQEKQRRRNRGPERAPRIPFDGQ